MAGSKIIFLSIPKGGKTDIINCLIDLQRDVINIGMYPDLTTSSSTEHRPEGKTSGKESFIYLKHKSYDLVEHEKADTAPDVHDAAGLIIVIPANDIYGERSKHIWNWAITTELPCIAFVNKLDLIMNAPKYMNKINTRITNTAAVNQKYLYDYLHYRKSKKSENKFQLNKQPYPLIFGSSVNGIGIFDLLKTMGQYFTE